MGLLQQPVQRQLSKLLGAQVTFERLNVSVLGGSVEAHGMTVAGDDPGRPVLTIRRLRAEVSVARALKREFVVRSLTIEAPVLSVVRRADGTTNLPRPVGTDVGDEAATTRAEQPTVDDDESGGSWKFEAQKILVVDGAASFRDERRPGAVYTAERILAEVTAASGGMDFTCIVESAGLRGDRIADVGPIKLAGRADGVTDLSSWRNARVNAHVDAGDVLKAVVVAPSVNPIEAELQLDGTAPLSTFAPFIPATLAAMLDPDLQGHAELSARARLSGGILRITELKVAAREVQVALAAK